MSNIYIIHEYFDDIHIKVEKNKNQRYMSFIDTKIKSYGEKVYEGYMFLEDDRLFQGYYYKSDLKQLINKRGKVLHEKVAGRTFKPFDKDIKLSWSSWFELIK